MVKKKYMPITKSAKKALRQSLGRRARNIQKKREIKNLLKEMGTLVSQKKVEEAKKLLPQVYKILDKAAKTGLIKKNTAARKKSRITLSLSSAKPSEARDEVNPQRAVAKPQ